MSVPCAGGGEDGKKIGPQQDGKSDQKGSQEMKGAQWMDIRSDRQKGLSYVDLGKK